MSITPLYFEPVGTDKSNAYWTYVARYGCRVEEPPAAHLLHAGRAGTCQPQLTGRIEAFVATLVPLDPQPVVLPIDGVRDRVLQWLSLFEAMSYEL